MWPCGLKKISNGHFKHNQPYKISKWKYFSSNYIVRFKSPSEVCKQNHTKKGKAGSSLWSLWELYLHRSKANDSFSWTVSNSLRF